MIKNSTINRILNTVYDYYSNPSNYISESSDITRDGIENEVTDKISITKNLVLKYSLEIGYFSFFNSKVYYTDGFSLDNKDFCRKFLQEEINRRKNHLEETIDVFGRKINGMDSSINFTRSKMVPFEYEAELFITFNIPPMLGQDAIFNMSPEQVRVYEKHLNERSERIKRWREFANANGGTNNVKNTSLFKRDMPGFAGERVKVGSVKVTGYSCEATFERPGFKIKGMDFIGKVTPYVNSDNTNMQFANVDLVDEYSSDISLIEHLKKTSAQIKCDLCGRKSSREIYFLFKDQNGNIHYYGRNCAEKAFGVDIIEKLNRFMAGLYKLGEAFAYNSKGYNVSDRKIKATILSMMNNDMINKKVEYKIVNSECGEFERVLNKLEEDPETVFSQEDRIAKFVKENKDEADRLYAQYMAYGTEFYNGYTVRNDFSDKLKAFSLALLSGDPTAFKKLPAWVLPFSLNNFFRFFEMKNEQSTGQTDEVSEDEPIAYPKFDSYKTFNCEIVGKKDAKTKYGKPYLSYQAYTVEDGKKYGIMWNDFRMNGTIWNIGDRVTVNGEYSKFNGYNSAFTNLDNVRTSPSEASAAQTDNMVDSGKYEVGVRLRDIPVVVKKVAKRYVVVETEDGMNFLIYTAITNDMGVDEPKFNIDFSENMKLRITGTVQKSQSGYMFLNRCKLNVINETKNMNKIKLNKLNEAQLGRVITEAVKRILKESLSNGRLVKRYQNGTDSDVCVYEMPSGKICCNDI